MNPATLICFLFLGHSNMSGYCSKPDTVTYQHIWSYNAAKGFFHCTDKTFSNGSGTVVMPFLKRMSMLYPGYDFCAIMDASPSQQASHIVKEERHRECVINQLTALKGKATIGGVLMMYGIVEAIYNNNINTLDESIRGVIDFVRGATGNDHLPVILGRFELNGDPTRVTTYHQWDAVIMEKINVVMRKDPLVQIAPIRYMPKEYYCDDHHYSAEGYKIWAEDAAALIQVERYDFWYKNE
jgi:hypothetical protein